MYFVVNLSESSSQLERSLARLFMQQLAHVPSSSTVPHCRYYRRSEAPKELVKIWYDTKKSGEITAPWSTDACLGLLSYTFFPTHLQTPEKRHRAVFQVLCWFPYLDKHMKGLQNYLHDRMSQVASVDVSPIIEQQGNATRKVLLRPPVPLTDTP